MTLLLYEKIKEHKSEALIALALLLTSVAVYSSALGNDFLVNWDDNLYVTENQDIKSITLLTIVEIFSSFYVGNYAPVQMFSYMLDYQIWGLNPLGYILHNIILNGLNVVLFYFVLRALGGTAFPSLLAAVFFMVHPVQVESVAWISQRKNLLAMFFFLLSFLLYHFYAIGVSRKRLFYGLANVAFLLALLAKSVAVVLPVVLVAYDLLLRSERKNFISILLEKIPFVLLTVLFAGLAMISQSSEFGGGGAIETYHGGSAYATFLTMLTVYQDYLMNIIWPVELSAAYGPVIRKSIDAQVVISSVLLVASFCLPFLFSGPRRRLAWFWMTVFFVSLLPISQIVPLVTLMNDRYLYFPMLGVSGFLAIFFHSGLLTNKSIKVAFVSLLVVLALLTSQRAKVWADRISLWQDATMKQENSVTAWYALGLAYDDAGDVRAAVAPYRKTLSISPEHLDALYNLALVYIVLGQFDDAQPLLEQAVRISPESVDVLTLAGHNYYFRNNLTMARIFYAKVLELEPVSPSSLNWLSFVERLSGNVEKGENYWQRALESEGDLGELYLDRARIESLARKEKSSLMYLSQAIKAGIKSPEKVFFDEDLEYVRNSPEFIAITQSLKH